MTKVVQFTEIGGPEVLKIVDIDVPAPQADEVQIRVKALGINRAEIMYRTGQYVIEPKFPARLGYEAAGDVIAVGPNVVDFGVGDRVSVIPAFSFADYGMYGELVNAPVHALTKIPEGISYTDAAATWMQYVTAYGALIHLGGLTAGDAVVIGAAASSVGLAAIQIANMVGAIPVALTRNPDKAAPLREAGAAKVILSADPGLADRVHELTDGRGARMVFDPVGGPGARSLVNALGTGGAYFQYGALDTRDLPIPVMDLLSRHLSLRGYELFEITQDREQLDKAIAFINDGLKRKALRPVIDRVFRFNEIAEAHRYMEASGQVGKIVVTV